MSFLPGFLWPVFRVDRQFASVIDVFTVVMEIFDASMAL